MAFIIHIFDGCAANSASLLASLIQVFRAGALAVKPHQRIQRPIHVGHEDVINVLRRVEQVELPGCSPALVSVASKVKIR